jgi:hypothetical protein
MKKSIIYNGSVVLNYERVQSKEEKIERLLENARKLYDMYSKNNITLQFSYEKVKQIILETIEKLPMFDKPNFRIPSSIDDAVFYKDKKDKKEEASYRKRFETVYMRKIQCSENMSVSKIAKNLTKIIKKEYSKKMVFGWLNPFQVPLVYPQTKKYTGDVVTQFQTIPLEKKYKKYTWEW